MNLLLTFVLLVIFITVIAICFTMNLGRMEENAKQRYLNICAAVQITRDRVESNFDKIEEVIENTRQKTFDELMEEAMSEDY